MVSLNRKDFLRLCAVGVAGVAGVVGSRYVNDLCISEHPTAKKENNDQTAEMFEVDKIWSSEQINALKNVFSDIGVNLERRSKRDNGSRKDIALNNFDLNLYEVNMNQVLDVCQRMQKTHAYITQDSTIEDDVKQVALRQLAIDFQTTIPLIQTVWEVSREYYGDNLLDMLIFQSTLIENDDIPNDPLFHENIYKSPIGRLSWFDFQVKDEFDGKKVYPITRLLFEDSGNLTKKILPGNFVNSEEAVNYSGYTRVRGVVDASEQVTYENKQIIEIPLDVKEMIMNELELLGIDYAFSEIYFAREKYNHNDHDIASAWFMGKGFIEIDLFKDGIISAEKYLAKKEQYNFVFSHEIWHSIFERIQSMNDKDRYIVCAMINLEFTRICKISDPKYFPRDDEMTGIWIGEDITAGLDIDGMLKQMIFHPNESVRERYLTVAIGMDTWNNYVSNMLMLYENVLTKQDRVVYKSSLRKIQLDPNNIKTWNDEMKRINRRRVREAISSLKSEYKYYANKMGSLERWLIEEMIDLEDAGGAFSDVLFCSTIFDVSEYINTILPIYLINRSLMSDDIKVLNLIEDDLAVIKDDDVRCETLRQIWSLAKKQKDNFRFSKELPMSANIAEEYLCDQFAMMMTTKRRAIDFDNPLSSLQTQLLLATEKSRMRKILDFFKQRNLALEIRQRM